MISVERKLKVLSGIEYRVEETSTLVKLFIKLRKVNAWEEVGSFTRDEWELLIGLQRPNLDR
jgi:hypothetical protein